MKFSIHPGLRWVLGRALLDATPSLIVSALLAFWLYKSWNEGDVGVPAFGLVIMLLVAAGRFGMHLWWLSRATQLLMTTPPIPMLLTADRGWKEIRLRALTHDAHLPVITDVRFITLGSGVACTAVADTRVEVCLDQAYPDLIVMRYDGKLLCSEVKQRFEQGHSSPVRESAEDTHPVPGDTSGNIGVNIVPPENPRMVENITALAQEARNTGMIVCIIAIIMLALFVVFTGVWRVVVDWQLLLRAPMPLVPELLIGVLFCGAIIYIIRSFGRRFQQILRGIWVVEHAAATQQRLVLTCQVSGNGDSRSETWLATVYDPGDTAQASPLFTVEMLNNMTQAQADSITGTNGLVYALLNTQEPVVMQTDGGVLICTRSTHTKGTEMTMR